MLELKFLPKIEQFGHCIRALTHEGELEMEGTKKVKQKEETQVTYLRAKLKYQFIIVFVPRTLLTQASNFHYFNST